MQSIVAHAITRRETKSVSTRRWSDPSGARLCVGAPTQQRSGRSGHSGPSAKRQPPMSLAATESPRLEPLVRTGRLRWRPWIPD